MSAIIKRRRIRQLQLRRGPKSVRLNMSIARYLKLRKPMTHFQNKRPNKFDLMVKFGRASDD